MKDESQVSRGERPEVEELSDLQWARIERGLWQRLEASPSESAEAEASRPRAGRTSGRTSGRTWMRGAAFGGALALAAVVALLVWVNDEEREGGERVGEAPARVMTSDSATTVSFAEAAIEVAPRSALLMSGSAERGATIVLERGRAGFHVAPRAAERPFVVVAGNAMVRVVGTRFEVARQGEEVEVHVREGKVDVRYLGQVHHVVAGESWSSPAAHETAVLLDAGGAVGASAEGSGAAASEVGARDAKDGSVEAADAAAPSGKPPRTRRPPPPATTPPDPPISTEPSASSRLADSPGASAPEPSETEQKAWMRAFHEATRLESSSPREALRRYEELSQRDDRLGANALFAAARLAFDVGDPERGARLARAYLHRFPTGLNAADARVLLGAR